MNKILSDLEVSVYCLIVVVGFLEKQVKYMLNEVLDL